MDRSTLEARKAELIEYRETERLAMEVAMLEGASVFAEQYPQMLTPADIRRETGFGEDVYGYQHSQPSDYEHGRYRPFYETEQDHQNQRAVGRYIAGSEPMAANVLRSLRNYVIGKGGEVVVESRVDGSEQLAADVERFVEDFLDLNDFTDQGESEAFLASVVDSDVLLALKDNGRNPATIRQIGGEHIVRPPDARAVEDYLGLPGLDWDFGVASDVNAPENVHGYYVDMYGAGGDNWEFVHAVNAVFIKRNVPRVCKRGLTDIYIVARELQNGSKLFDHTVYGATVQASIAYIVKAAKSMTTAQVGNSLNGMLTGTRTVIDSAGTRRQVTSMDHRRGQVINTNDKDYAEGPGGRNSPAFIAVYKAVAERVGGRWNMPGYMVTGDPSNGNLASTFVAESPFIKSIESEQSALSRHKVNLIWKAVEMAARHGRFGGVSRDELYARLTIRNEYPSAVVRNPLQDEQVRDSQQNAGILSPRTRALQSQLDYDHEVQMGAKVAVPQPSPFMQQRVAESRIQSLRFSLLDD